MAPEDTNDVPMPGMTEPTTRPQPPTQPSTSTTADPKKKKRQKRHQKPHILRQSTLRHPQWCYIHLRHISTQRQQQRQPDLDAVTAHLHLTTALQQFLGLHGTAIAFDVLKLEEQDVWIRAQSKDQRALVAAAGGWINGKGEGWRVVGWSHWDAGVTAGAREGGQDVFDD